MSSRLLALLALGAAFQPVSRADVLILEAPELGSFRDPQAAIDLAPEGSTLVFGPEDIGGFTIQGKSLTLVGPPAGGVTVRSEVEVLDLGSEQSLRITGLHFAPDYSFDPLMRAAVTIRDCEGSVRLANCSVAGVAGINQDDDPEDGRAAVQVLTSDDVAILGSTLAGGQGGGGVNLFCCTGGGGGIGLEVADSALALYDSEVRGGEGGQAGFEGGPGGSAMLSTNTKLFIGGTAIQGGDGGDADDFIVCCGGVGGDGLSAFGLPKPKLLDITFDGGQGGKRLLGGIKAPDGEALNWDLGFLFPVPGAQRSLAAPVPDVEAGEPIVLDVSGLAGDRFFIAAAQGDARGVRRWVRGVGLLPKPIILPTTPQLTLAADGTQQLALAGITLPAGTRSATWVVQAFVRDGQGKAAISSAVLVTVYGDPAGTDCDSNGRWDLVDILQGDTDCDGNLELDLCQTLPDCNGNGIADGIETDCLGAPDINDNGVPDSCEVETTIYVDRNAAPGGDGSLAAPFRDLKAAMSVLLDGWTIRVADGLYLGPNNRFLVPDGRGFTLESMGGASQCTIDLGGVAPLLFTGSTAGPTVFLRGLTVRNGFGGEGGAVFARFQRFVIEDCAFQANTSKSNGGALYISTGSEVRNCTFTDNGTLLTDSNPINSGGGAILARGSIDVSNCIFDRNESNAGGAIYVQSTTACPEQTRISHSVFRQNEAGHAGGAIYAKGCTGTQAVNLAVDNCFFGVNAAAFRGGAIHVSDPFGSLPMTLSLTNSTLVENSAGAGMGSARGGGGLWVGNHSTALLSNTIFWNNSAGIGSQVRAVGTAAQPAQVDVNYCSIEGGAAGFDPLFASVNFGSGNQDQDPEFMNPPLDYRLSAGSPCVDAGSVGLLATDFGDVDGDGDDQEQVPLDLLGADRRLDDPSAADTGSGAAPLPDLGAFERQP